MYYINKIIGWILSPLGILFLGLGLAWAFANLRFLRRIKGFHGETGERRARIVGKWFCSVTLVVVWLLGCGITTRVIGVALEGDEIDVCSQPVESFGKIDAIVLLGGGMGVHQKCGRAEMLGGADRVWTAAKLWQKLKLPITVSGGGAEAEKAFLRDFGVPEEMTLSFAAARNTEEEARMIYRGVVEREVGVGSGREVGVGSGSGRVKPRILLVTSAWHMPRSKMLFECAGFEVVSAPTDYEMTYALEGTIQPRDFFPQADDLCRNAYALKEWVARFFYWIKG